MVHSEVAIERQNGRVLVLAPKRDEGLALVDDQALFVRAAFDDDDAGLLVLVGNGVDRGLDGLEVSASVGRDNDDRVVPMARAGPKRHDDRRYHAEPTHRFDLQGVSISGIPLVTSKVSRTTPSLRDNNPRVSGPAPFAQTFAEPNPRPPAPSQRVAPD